MPLKIFPTENPNEVYRFFELDNCNQVNPIEQFKTEYIQWNIGFQKKLSPQSFKTSFLEIIRLKTIAEQEWNTLLEKSLNLQLPIELYQLFVEQKKKNQQKLIKLLKFRTELFQPLYMQAWFKHNLSYSRFSIDHFPKDLHNKKMPLFFHKEDNGSFNYFGKTDLSSGQMDAALKQRNRVVAEFIGDENLWYCFFRTMSGIKGKEEPHLGYPHIHYISNAWGIEREVIIDNLMSYRYNIKAETIPFEGTRNNTI